MRNSDGDARPGGAWRLKDTLVLPFSPRTWVAFLFLVLSFAIGLAWFIVLVTLIATGFGMLITLLGLPILVFTAVLWTCGARLERWRMRERRAGLFHGSRCRPALPAGCPASPALRISQPSGGGGGAAALATLSRTRPWSAALVIEFTRSL